MTEKQKTYLGNIFKNSRIASHKTQTDVIYDCKSLLSRVQNLERGLEFDGDLVLFYIRNYFRPKDIIRVWQFDKWFDSVDVKEADEEFKTVKEAEQLFRGDNT